MELRLEGEGRRERGERAESESVCKDEGTGEGRKGPAAFSPPPERRESGAHSERVFPLHPVRSLPLSLAQLPLSNFCVKTRACLQTIEQNFVPLHLSSLESWGERMEHIM